MKLGVLTAAFPDLTLDQVADWASRNDLEALEIACWPADSGATRRYGGVCHIDVDGIDRRRAGEIRNGLNERGLSISALAYYPNPLDPDPDAATAARAHLRKVITVAQLLEVDLVCTFVGGDPGRPVAANLEAFSEVWPELIRFAADGGTRIAIENCPMIFSADEWPGGKNIAYSPAIWRQMFEIIPDSNFGLNFDPSHLVWQFIDCSRAIREFGDRIFHTHAKDVEVRTDGLYEHGIMSAGVGWQVPRLCGLGQVDWGAFFAGLYSVGYDYVSIIEHEDRAFEGTVEAVQRGVQIARDNLRPYIR
ncbi:MAG: sugar phosphate isomerase/epimerase [Solirubrobacteraceae bacterium]